jgi:oligopeptide transport system permease protein
MIPFILQKALQAAITLCVLLTGTFFLVRLAPGGPFDGDKAWPEDVQRLILEKYGLDLPLYQQFYRWLSDLAHGNLRESFHFIGTPVTEIIALAIPPSLTLGLYSLVLSVVLGGVLGVIAAWKRGTFLDTSATLIAVAGMTLPSYLLATLLVLLFSSYLNWLPPALWEDPRSMILPILTLSLRPTAVIARMVRTSMLESLQADYIRTALAKGLDDRRVLFKHALKNSLIPVITLLGPITASLITGSYVVEIVFQIPGLGQYFITSVLNRDYPLVMGMTLTYGIVLIFCHWIVDILYGWIDPRIRTRES